MGFHCSRSTDFVIVVTEPFWCKVFLQKWASGKKGPTTEGDALEEQNQTQTPQLRNEAQLNCVSLRPQLDYEVAWRAVKGQDERQKTAPLTTLHATREAPATLEKKYKESRHVGLTFMTFS